MPSMIDKICSCAISTLNVITALVSLAAIGWSIRIHFFRPETATHCQHTLESVLLVGGLALLAVSLLGIGGNCLGVKYLFYPYLFILLLLIIAWFALSIFIFIVTHKGVGKAISQVSIDEHHLGDFSHWLHHHVVTGKTWVQISSCLRDAKVCDNKTSSWAQHEVIYPVQFGCCTPPEDCGIFSPNGTRTSWEPNMAPSTARNDDCNRWSNDPLKLCYDCNSCKTSVLYDIHNSWRLLVVANALIIFFLIVVFFIACFARRAIVRNGAGSTYHPA